MDQLKQSLTDLSDIFGAKMTAFQDALNKGAAGTMSPSAGSGLQAEFNEFRSFVVLALTTLQRQVDLLSRDMDAMEMRSRRKMLLIHGMPEVGKEDTTAAVVEVLTKYSIDVGCGDIGRTQRMGRPVKARTRPVLVKFRSMEARNKGWLAKKNLKGSGVTISEFLTKPRHDAFMEARKIFGVSKCWTRDGTIYVLMADGEQRRALTCAEVKQLPSSTSPGVSVPASPMPADPAPSAHDAPVEAVADEQDVVKTRGGRPKRKAATSK